MAHCGQLLSPDKNQSLLTPCSAFFLLYQRSIHFRLLKKTSGIPYTQLWVRNRKGGNRIRLRILWAVVDMIMVWPLFVNYCHFYYKFLKKVWPHLYYTKSFTRIKLTDSLSKYLEDWWLEHSHFLFTILSTIFTHTERFLCARHNAWQIEHHCLTLPLRSFQFEDRGKQVYKLP